MKKVAPLFLASLLAFNSFVLLLFYLGEMEQCRLDAVNYIASGSSNSSLALTIFREADKNFHLLNSKEIISNGKLYDIVKIEESAGNKTYYAISDKKEDVFWRNVSELAQNNDTNRQLPEKNITPDASKYIGEERADQNSFPNHADDKIPSFQKSTCYQSPFSDIFSPPPRNLVS